MRPNKFQDQRGSFIKTYHHNTYSVLGIDLTMEEEFYSLSNKNVIRGMHFQQPPHAHNKLVYCPHGAALDVLLDLRRGTTYGQVAVTELTADNGHILYIPKGVAHGFLSLEDQTLMVYKTSTAHAPQSDMGIHWASFGFNWSVTEPILSARDQEHVSFSDYQSSF